MQTHLKNIDEYIKNQRELEKYQKECEEADKQKAQVASENDNHSRSASQVIIHNNHKNESHWSIGSLFKTRSQHLQSQNSLKLQKHSHASISSISTISSNTLKKNKFNKDLAKEQYSQMYIQNNAQKSTHTITSHASEKDEKMLQKFSEKLSNKKFIVQSEQSLFAKTSTQSLKSETQSKSDSASDKSIQSSIHFSSFFKQSKKNSISDQKNDNASKNTMLIEQKTSSRKNSRSNQNSLKSESEITLKKDSSSSSLNAIDQLLKQIDENDAQIQKAHKFIKEIKPKKHSKMMRFLSIFVCGVCKSGKSKFD